MSVAAAKNSNRKISCEVTTVVIPSINCAVDSKLRKPAMDPPLCLMLSYTVDMSCCLVSNNLNILLVIIT
jgi:hypothetical protein